MKNNKIYSIISFAFLTVVYIFLSFTLFLKDPAVWPDEPYFVNIAENFLKAGVPFLDLYGKEGLGSPHLRALSYPPLYNYFLSLWIWVFGSNISSVRGLSVCVGFFTILLFWSILRNLTNQKLAFLGTLTLLLFAPFGASTRVGRMDIFIIFFTLASYKVLLKQINPKNIFYSGVLSTFSLLLHPIGVISFVAPIVSVLTAKVNIKTRLKLIIYFIFPLLISLGFWLLTIASHFELFLTQMQIQFGFKSSRTALISLLFQNDPIWRLIILICLLVGFIGFVSGFYLKLTKLKVLATASFISLIIVILGVDQWYLPYIIIFPIITILHLIFLASARFKRAYLILYLFLLLPIGFQTAKNLMTNFKQNNKYVPFANTIMENLPQGSKVALSVIPDPYFVLKKRPDLEILQVPHVSTKEGLDQLLKNVDFLIFNFATNEFLPGYINTHLKDKITISQTDGYVAEIIKLK